MQQIIFEFVTQYGVFRDALYLPEDHQFSDSEIETMKQQRLDNWLMVVAAVPETAVPETAVPETAVPETAVPEEGTLNG